MEDKEKENAPAVKKPKKKYVGGTLGRRQPSKLLRNMRWVFDHEEVEDQTEGHRHCRELLKQDKQKFIAQLGQLERSHKPARVVQADPKTRKLEEGVEKLAEDQGSEKVLELIDRLLGEWDDQSKQPGQANRLA